MRRVCAAAITWWSSAQIAPRLYATMLAAQSLGAIHVPLYQDAAGAECVFPINNADIKFAVVEDQEQVDKLLEVREQCPQIARIVYDDPRGLRKYDEECLTSMDDFLAQGQAFTKQNPQFVAGEIAKCQPDDVAAMFFTSGTRATPRASFIPITACLTAPVWVRALTSWSPPMRCWPICHPPGLVKTSSATPNGWRLVTWSTVLNLPPR